jgi:hypothetical protein
MSDVGLVPVRTRRQRMDLVFAPCVGRADSRAPKPLKRAVSACCACPGGLLEEASPRQNFQVGPGTILESTRQPFPASKPGSQAARQPASQSASQPASQPGSQPARQPVSQPARQPASQPASQPSSQAAASQRTSQPTRQPARTGQATSNPARQAASQQMPVPERIH